jgi:hypothetical protein
MGNRSISRKRVAAMLEAAMDGAALGMAVVAVTLLAGWWFVLP